MRRKGEFNIAYLDKDYPHQVALPIDVAVDVKRSRPWYPSMAERCGSFRRGDQDFIVACFADKADALRFYELTSGEWLVGGHRKFRPK